jgi:hypothetical protein
MNWPALESNVRRNGLSGEAVGEEIIRILAQDMLETMAHTYPLQRLGGELATTALRGFKGQGLMANLPSMLCLRPGRWFQNLDTSEPIGVPELMA